MIKVDWLDRLTFREIELINEKEKRSSNFMFLMIEFPRICAYGIEYTVVYFEEVSLKIFLFSAVSKCIVLQINNFFLV